MILIHLTNSLEYLPTITRYYNTSQPVLIIGTTDRLTIFDTGQNDINLEASKKYNATLISYTSNGGAAISNIGDLGIYFGLKGYNPGWCKYIFKSLKVWLNTKQINAYEENNDLLIHGKKVMGYTEHPTQEYSSGSIFIAMKNSQQLVNEICMKPKTRITTGLNDYGITANEISEVIIQATQNYLNSIGVEGGI